jgi:hypothetical protein
LFSVDETFCVIKQSVNNQLGLLLALVAAATALGGAITLSGAIQGAQIALLAFTLTQIGEYRYDIYGKPIGETVPFYIWAQAKDTNAQAAQQGQIVEEVIDNPLIDQLQMAQDLADFYLLYYQLQKKRVTATFMKNLAFEPLDFIQAFNPRYNFSLKFMAQEVEHHIGRRNDKEVTIVKGALVP